MWKRNVRVHTDLLLAKGEAANGRTDRRFFYVRGGWSRADGYRVRRMRVNGVSEVFSRTIVKKIGS